ncbi:DNA double-strand break repair nuclease NurA [Thermocoleostomius sinensis]|uniref:DNA double-strand break repair nuclease NurA n=1 Tax=Thermocoleostomius sinensis A174 TaxID=2016057 RepID=A0A9E8ZMF9_9CYAN|nr:DNA double-strand break repair nuclease NurA [Thermocoleostomius sinensis]WAL61181.1 DNA double-strand break repair nuclease NurA [Thermocoleostomius sinensis A174]
MLDLIKLARQLQDIGQHLNDEATAARLRLERAQTLLQQARDRQTELVEQQQAWRDRMGFTAATPLEPLDTRLDLTAAPPVHTVIATDGSQIAPSHHEIAYCYLINVGRVVLHYGQNRHPILDSLPEVFYRPDDLYGSRQWGIRTEEWMGYRRTVSEAVVLAELGTSVRSNLQSAPNPRHWSQREPAEVTEVTYEQTTLDGILAPSSLLAHPCLAMVDGSLIHWFLEPLPMEARDRILPPILDAWNQLQAARIPLVGYLSVARSGEALNFLRLHSCPYSAPDCLTHCPGATDQAPCQVFAPLRDTALWELLLEPGQRGPIWRSSAKILECYGDHTICFCYVHMGSEIARVEFPLWVATDPTLLTIALSLTLTQVQKGYGYPVALAEAHNQAVVRGGDRARFFALLEQQMIRAGLKNIGTSYKEARKRGSIA